MGVDLTYFVDKTGFARPTAQMPGDGPTWTGHVTRTAQWFSNRRTILPDMPIYQDVRTLECVIQLDTDQPPPRLQPAQYKAIPA